MPWVLSKRAGLLASAVIALCSLVPVAGETAAAPRPKSLLEELGTGLVPLDPAEYAKLPGVKRHRAWNPPAVDLSGLFPPPGYQGGQGTCAAWATSYAARAFLMANERGGRPLTTAEAPSPDYVYGRVKGGVADCRSGMLMKTALDILKNEGVVPWSDFPHVKDQCPLTVPDTVRSKAARLRIGDWKKIDRKDKDDDKSPLVIEDLKSQLAARRPVVVSYPVSEAFVSPGPGKGIWKGEPGPGSHALAVVGYDNEKQALRVMNSWGIGWGDGGFAWIDYDTFVKNAGEAYVLFPPGTQAEIAPPSAPPAAPTPTTNVGAEINARLANTRCAALHLADEGGRRVVKGFGGEAPALDEARAAVLALDPKVEWRVAYHKWPQCEAELTLAGLTEDRRVRLEVKGSGGEARSGDPIVLTKGEDIAVGVETTPDKPFVQVIYIQADGSAVEVYSGAPKAGADGKLRAVVGADGPRGERLRVNDPLGEESLVAVASAGPLFGEELKRPEVTEREFLTLLKSKLVAAQRDNRAVSAAVLRMRSRAG